MLHHARAVQVGRGARSALLRAPLHRAPVPVLPCGAPAAPLRRLATAPPRDSSVGYATKMLADPAMEFVTVLSRVARILIGSAALVGGVTLLGWEGTHQYVEHSAMRRGGVRGGAPDGDADAYEWGIADAVANIDTPYGTDPRLGFFGRHIVRSAWMAEHWGGGIAPATMLGRRAATDARDLAEIAENQGLVLAEQFLTTALHTAERRKIVVADASPDAVPDPAALTLEAWLANVREKIGTPRALTLASLGTEKLYDVLPRTHDAYTDALRGALASRLAVLLARLGSGEQALPWVDRAVGGSARGVVDDALAGRLPRAHEHASTARTQVAALVALSHVHVEMAAAAKNNATRRSQLQDALHTQLATLRILGAERQRHVTAPHRAGAEKAAALQALWAQQQEAVLSVHVAETLYALHAAAPRASWLSRIPAWWTYDRLRDARPASWLHAAAPSVPPGPHAASRQWLAFAAARAESVQRALVHAPGSNKLQACWDPHALHREGVRLLHASREVDKDAELLLQVLMAQGSGPSAERPRAAPVEHGRSGREREGRAPVGSGHMAPQQRGAA
ncbi:hypothetical protein MSPP1_000362 [Malassezia sp. CBS 17886]|nr:hypothetical protein MSPP1_000362 [Malassezia sp. CBS 17886]